MWDTTPISYVVTTDLDSPIFRHFEKAFKNIKK